MSQDKNPSKAAKPRPSGEGRSNPEPDPDQRAHFASSPEAPSSRPGESRPTDSDCGCSGGERTDEVDMPGSDGVERGPEQRDIE